MRDVIAEIVMQFFSCIQKNSAKSPHVGMKKKTTTTTKIFPLLLFALLNCFADIHSGFQNGDEPLPLSVDSELFWKCWKPLWKKVSC